MIRRPKIEEVRELRETASIGMMEAKKRLLREAMLTAVNEATTFEDLREIVRELVKEY